MAGKVFENSLAVLLMISMCFVPSSAQVGCMPAFTSLSPCLGYITSNSVTPSDSCCTQVAAVVKTQAQCLCSFLGSSTATQLGTIVNQAQALSLPGACKIDNPLANQCNGEQHIPISCINPRLLVSGNYSVRSPNVEDLQDYCEPYA
ncbi:hypothetical protein KFK09_016171 [Dendrobium nobile]|uniref:Bifunctional inhibitor/plant lipid transfer protein/seed storage helical domain-containing protein n=1 Tax=Dendrobium nobile TaxID=94219 RepID=A0A8T3AZ59_DENNO|nr:hypothetical protein KFK09_016171 [Dendrobium nobile]